MERHAYLIMAHNQWNTLIELVKALDDPRNDIYLHLDKKASLPPEAEIKGVVTHSNLYFTKQFNIVWGGTQMLKCTLNMLEEASSDNYTYYHFISGVDYPLKSQDEIHDFFASCGNQQFVAYDWNGVKAGRFLNRVQYYHFFSNIIGKNRSASIPICVLSKLDGVLLAIQRFLKINRVNYKFYKGSSWFSITKEVAAAILKEKNKTLNRYRLTLAPDEVWLQTFIQESEFAGQIADSNLRYIKWIQGKSSPETLTMDDYENMVSSGKLFARKFDWDKDHDVILKLRTHNTGELSNGF